MVDMVATVTEGVYRAIVGRRLFLRSAKELRGRIYVGRRGAGFRSFRLCGVLTAIPGDSLTSRITRRLLV